MVHFVSWLIFLFQGPKSLIFSTQGLGHVFAIGALVAYRRSVLRFEKEPEEEDLCGPRFSCSNIRIEDDVVDASIHLMHVPHTPIRRPLQRRDQTPDADEYDSDSDTSSQCDEQNMGVGDAHGDEDSPPRYQERCSTGGSPRPPAYRPRPTPTTFYELLAEIQHESGG